MPTPVSDSDPAEAGGGTATASRSPSSTPSPCSHRTTAAPAATRTALVSDRVAAQRSGACAQRTRGAAAVRREQVARAGGLDLTQPALVLFRAPPSPSQAQPTPPPPPPRHALADECRRRSSEGLLRTHSDEAAWCARHPAPGIAEKPNRRTCALAALYRSPDAPSGLDSFDVPLYSSFSIDGTFCDPLHTMPPVTHDVDSSVGSQTAAPPPPPPPAPLPPHLRRNLGVSGASRREKEWAWGVVPKKKRCSRSRRAALAAAAAAAAAAAGAAEDASLDLESFVCTRGISGAWATARLSHERGGGAASISVAAASPPPHSARPSVPAAAAEAAVSVAAAASAARSQSSSFPNRLPPHVRPQSAPSVRRATYTPTPPQAVWAY